MEYRDPCELHADRPQLDAVVLSDNVAFTLSSTKLADPGVPANAGAKAEDDAKGDVETTVGESGSGAGVGTATGIATDVGTGTD